MSNIKLLLLAGFIVSVLINIFLIYQLVSKEEVSSHSFDSDEISFAFSDIVNDPKKLLLQAINGANNTLDIAIYNFGDKEIARAVLDAEHRGVKVRVITDD